MSSKRALFSVVYWGGKRDNTDELVKSGSDHNASDTAPKDIAYQSQPPHTVSYMEQLF